ncbi:ketose 1,6-bisphosphate aldolase [Aliagarivorans marinus]|uniref:ketose 1,6-bisphosphate aldolase n=1 Tax=Aliagarivorans marinus TaxID=561965 RepID=UPI00041A88F2|nr:ketose 1,6-bisphosphate aldolase [Aliagarivorans marinus]
MPLINLAQGLAIARDNNAALGAFNVIDTHFINALFSASARCHSPFIINIAEVHFPYLDLESIVAAIQSRAARHSQAVVLNLDHGSSFDAIVKAIRAGFTSIMFDGSSLSYDENIRQTREVVKLCHAAGVSVEAELGAVGGSEGGELYGSYDQHKLTDVNQAAQFIEQTQVDALAVAIGNVHGKYRGAPELDFERLKAINAASTVPLVLHGGSGISDADFRRAIDLGIRKINFFTGMSDAALTTLGTCLSQESLKYDKLAQSFEAMELSISEVVCRQMQVFGNRVPLAEL